MNHRSRLFFAVVVFMAVPQNAWANAGTPLMWAGMIHLVVGNAVIGVLEGLLLGDAPLTSASRAWLNEWLAEHGASEPQSDQERNEAVGESLEAPGAPPADVTP